MKILDQLLKMDGLPAKDRKQIVRLVMSNNAIFAKYMDLCYNYESRQGLNAGKLKYRKTESPMGMDFGSLESVYSKFYHTVYDSDNGQIDNELAETRLIQIFEIVSDIEVDFLKQIMKGKYKGLTKKEYDTACDVSRHLI